MEVARGVGKEAVVEILVKFTKQETEVTEVSHQLHVGNLMATTMPQNLCNK